MLEYYRFKQIYDLFSKGQFEEAKRDLTDLQRRYVSVCDENTTYRAQVQEYEDILYLARNLFFDGTFFWLVTGSIKQGPFCPECYNGDGLLMRLAGEGKDRHCPSCRTRYPKSEKPKEETPSEEVAVAVPHERNLDSFSQNQKTNTYKKVLPFRS